MRKVISAAVVALVVLATSHTAQATEARAQSLLYNMAFENSTDIFMFPNLLPDYEGLYFYLPRLYSNVYGGAVLNLGGDHTIGAFVHRPMTSSFDQYRMAATDNPVPIGLPIISASNALETKLAGQAFDLMYGARSFGIGLRLHVWSSVSAQNPPLVDPAETDTAITPEINAGIRLGHGLNLRANLALRSVSDTYILMMGRVGMRYLPGGDQRIRPVLAGELEFAAVIPDDDTLENSYAFMLPIKGGIRLAAVKDVLTIALLAGLDVQILSPGDEKTRFGLVLPNLELAAEWVALDWLQVRSAIKGGFGMQLAGHPDGHKPKVEQMVFSSGLGIPLGPFSIDAVIQYSMWQNGPWFVGGTPGLFAGVSLAYRWGAGIEVASADAPVEDPAPRVAPMKPAPAAKPAPKPAPAKTKPAEPDASAKPKPDADKKSEDGGFEGW